ncbi:gliding motility-associated C-terminal domain-containing protein, partial [Flavobacteriales bacterium]|nr:gliding motility-associated C-terminal domain-containing protein [Flavobacteriales bacterium]
LDSGIFLEAGSFYSPPLSVINNLGIDSTDIEIACNSTVILTADAGIGATYEWFDSTSTIFSTNASVTIGEGIYVVSADISGCAIISDTLNIIEGDSPTFNLGVDLMIPCNADTLIDPLVSGGTAPYSYFWNSGDTDSMIVLSEGVHSVVVTDTFGCVAIDTLEIFYDSPPEVDFTFDGLVFDYIKDVDTIACNSTSYYGPVSILGGSSPFTYLWEDISLSFVSSADSVLLGDGLYYLTVTDTYGCYSIDTLEIFYDSPPEVDLGIDYNIECNTTTNISPNILGGTQPYSYLWSNGSTDSSIDIAAGDYTVVVSDLNDCIGSDAIAITENSAGIVNVSGDRSMCYGDPPLSITFVFNGLLPWKLVFTDGDINYSIPLINDLIYTHTTSEEGLYSVVEAKDINGCVTINIGSSEITVNPLPEPVIFPMESVIYEGEQIELSVGTYSYYEWYSKENNLIDTLSTLMVSDSGSFYVWVVDDNGCENISDPSIVSLVPLTKLFIPSVFTPNGDKWNQLFVIKGEYIKSFNIKIFSSWGEQIFESNNIGKCWDGTFKNKQVQQGTYYYNIEVVGEDGNLLVRSGSVKVIY